MAKTSFRPVEKPDQIRSYWKRQVPILALVTLFGITFDGLTPYMTVLQGRLIDALVLGETLPGVQRSAAIFVGTVLVVQLARYGKRYYVRLFANRTMMDMRMMLYNNIMHRDILTLSKESTGDLMVKAVSDVDICVEGMRKVTTEIFDTGVLAISYLAAMLFYDVKITVLCCIFVPLAMLLAEYLKSTIVHLSKAARAQSSRVAERTYRDINQMVLQRVNGLEARWQESYFKELDKLEETSIKASILEGSLQPIYKVIAMLGIMAVLYLGGGKVIDGSWTVGSFTAYLAIFAALSGKASKTAKLFTSYQKAKVSWERIKQYLTPHQRTDQADHALTLPAKLTVHDLCFTYPESEEMKISHLSFQADSGQILGVTGPVASGKTTLGVALGGLYPYEGSIQLNGEELQELTPFQISRRIAVLSHRPQLLSDSIYHNITLGDGGDIATVLHHVCFDEDLKRMPQGIDTMVGSSGVRLSGGQQARIALARALYHETPLIILDDPFSAVDMKTERKIIANLKKYYQNSILVLISHRLAVFPDTDLVILLKTNRESEQGVHDELLETSSDYHTLYQLQMGEEAHEA